MFRSLVLDLPHGISVSVNDELSLSAAARKSLLELIAWMTNNGVVFSDVVAKTLAPLPKIGVKFSFQNAFKILRDNLDGDSEKLTCYKYMFASAVASAKPNKELFSVLKKVRDFINLPKLEFGLVHDAVVGESARMVMHSYLLPEPDRLAIVALSCILLRIDHATHVNETEALRLVTTSLRTGAIHPASLMSAMGKPPLTLFNSLNPAGKPWAMLFLLRIAGSDGGFRPSELKLILGLARDGGVDPFLFRELEKVNYLESELSVPASF